MYYQRRKAGQLLVLALLLCITITYGQEKKDFPITPIPFSQVGMEDDFWKPRIEKNYQITIPHAIDQCESRIQNFRIAAGLASGSFQTGLSFDDSEVYKVIQGASYSLHYYDDPELDNLLDSLINIIGMAQEDDGYICTVWTINGPNGHEWMGSTRWEKVEELSHELYNIGHLLESASAHYEVTGKTNFLDIAIKAADCVDGAFGWGKLEKYPGHQEIEKGLVALYRATGEEKYLDLAQFFLDVRKNGEEYSQSHLPVTEQTEAVGHSVRAMYMYSGMADVAAIKDVAGYAEVLPQIWKDIIYKKIYITGGIGASGGNEGFDEAYNLPNANAYCETCASIGNMYFNHRLFLTHGEAKYIDVMERTLYNSLLSGVSYSGDRFFYPNRLQSNDAAREAWFYCSCCPSNMTRIIPSMPGYIYAQKTDTIYVNLFAASTTSFDIDGQEVTITQETDYPWDGQVELSVSTSSPLDFTLMIRVPGWAKNEVMEGDLYHFHHSSEESASLLFNDESYSFSEYKGYIPVHSTWQDGDQLTYSMPMPVRQIFSNENIVQNQGKMAIQRGPMVYCTEFADNPDLSSIFYYQYDSAMTYTASFDPELFYGTEIIQGASSTGESVTFLPYHLWNNRGTGEMQVWNDIEPARALADSLIIINTDNGDQVSANYVSPWEDLQGIYDLYDPSSSIDKEPYAFGNWSSDGSTINSWNWIEYQLSEKHIITSSEVYWWKDGEGIDLPDEAYISYYNEETQEFVALEESRVSKSEGEIAVDQYCLMDFNAKYTDRIRLNFMGSTMAQGVLEWLVYERNAPLNVDKQEMSIYPNPASDKIWVEGAQVKQVEILNLSGQLVKPSSSSPIDISQLPKGVFFLKIKTEDDKHQTIKFVKD